MSMPRNERRVKQMAERVGTNIEALMNRRSMSLSDLARATGISYKSLIQIKFGRTKGITYQVLDALCRVLDCKVTEILN